MEENKRGLDSGPVYTPSGKGGYQSSKEFTIMLIGSVGKTYSFKVSRKLILYLSIFFSIFLIISLLTFYLYFDLYGTYRNQSERVKHLQDELYNKSKSLEQSEFYIKSLEEYKNTLHGESKNKGEVNIPRDKILQEKEHPEETPGVTEKSGSAPIVGKTENYVDIKDVVLRRVDSELIFDFKISNNHAGQNPAEGYVHIIAMDKNKDCPSEWNFGNIKLSGCFPTDYNSGQHFLIQKFKPYQRRFNISPDVRLPSFIMILVYDASGRKIIEKEFPVNDLSANDPG